MSDTERVAVAARLLDAGDEEGCVLAQHILTSIKMSRKVVRNINRTTKNQVVKNVVGEAHHHYKGRSFTELGWRTPSSTAVFFPFCYVAPDGRRVHMPYGMVESSLVSALAT